MYTARVNLVPCAQSFMEGKELVKTALYYIALEHMVVNSMMTSHSTGILIVPAYHFRASALADVLRLEQQTDSHVVCPLSSASFDSIIMYTFGGPKRASQDTFVGCL